MSRPVRFSLWLRGGGGGVIFIGETSMMIHKYGVWTSNVEAEDQLEEYQYFYK